MKTLILSSTAACSLLFTSCGEKVDTGVNKDSLSPEEAVQNWKKDAVDGRVASLWDSLPKSYQSDVEGIVHTFGEKADAEVYNEALKTASAAANLLESKKSIILELIKESAPPNKKDQLASIEKNYDSIVGLLKAIVDSDAKTIDGLKVLDIAKFCADIQPHTKTLAELAAIADKDMDISKVKAATVKLLSKSDDKAEVEVSMEGKKPQKFKVVKVEKRWVPEEMEKDWNKQIGEAKDSVSKVQEMSAVEKEKVLSAMRLVQAAIKDLESANTKEELQEKAQKAMGEIMGGLSGR